MKFSTLLNNTLPLLKIPRRRRGVK